MFYWFLRVYLKGNNPLYVKNMGKDINSKGNAFVHIYFSAEGNFPTFCVVLDKEAISYTQCFKADKNLKNWEKNTGCMQSACAQNTSLKAYSSLYLDDPPIFAPSKWTVAATVLGEQRIYELQIISVWGGKKGKGRQKFHTQK